MRIAVDCHVLTGKFQGSRTYLWNLYNALVGLGSGNEFVCFGNWQDEKPFGELVQYANYRSPSRIRRLTFGTNRLVRNHNINLLHSTYISPLMARCRQLVTIHDILFETHPQFFSKSFVIRSRALVRLSAKRADQIHTISEFTRRSLIDIYRIKPEKVKLVPVGVDRLRFSRNDRDGSIKRVEALTGLKDYILTVGRLEPRKNHITLIEAYDRFRARVDNAPPLLIVGQKDFGYEKIYDIVKIRNLRERIHFLESADDNMVADIYRAARMFVYPSYAEGFGIPVLEAMASGVPVVTSNCTAIPEVVGDSGLQIDPHNADEIAEALYRLQVDDKLRSDLAESGLVQSHRWTWERSAGDYLRAVAELG